MVYVFGGQNDKTLYYEKTIERIPLKALLQPNLDISWELVHSNNMRCSHSLIVSLREDN